MYASKKINSKETNNGKSLFAIDNFVAGEIIFEFEKRFSKTRTRTSMQIDEEIHQECSDSNAIENFLNHSCSPNGYIDFDDMTYRASRNIKKGEELTFNYLTTELELANKFQCQCGEKNCYGFVQGFRYLSLEQQKKLESFLSPFLKKEFKKISKR
ncbi:MAG: SET domain-containing methyltransferase [Nanoarchaeota archaeon]|nr:SET domain-containing methyltransferase [Nanoarchaeota archaeon]